MNILERVSQLDYWLFFKINGKWTSNFLDIFFPLFREPIIWLPLYLFLAVFAGMNFGYRGLYWLVALVSTVAICDIVSSYIIKDNIFRVAPCRNSEVGSQVRLLTDYCATNSGFISPQATTQFGIAWFLQSTLREFTAGYASLVFVWAALIGYAEIYAGLNFPVAIFFGALVGCLLGYFTTKLFNNYINLTINPLKTNNDN